MNEMTLSTKEEIRREALRRRNLIPDEERAKASLVICHALSEDDLFIDARGVHVYLPFGSEVDIHPILELSWELGKDVGLMRVSEDGGTAQYSILPSTNYQRSRLGILEPTDAEPFDMNVCDLVIVPTLAADLECNRLGYGKGYYDQFLAHYPRPTIGVTFDQQIFDTLPCDELDIKLDMIYTELRTIGEGR